ncbi:MAG: hypothetical protein JWQ15_1755 [Marmoricola sp.]|nr:hypothetical protein [Marmoricola sp.]
MDSPDHASASSEASAPAPWNRRVLPVTLVLVLAIGLAGAVVPSFRHQLQLSLTRQPTSYVELYFAAPTSGGARAACTRKGAQVRVRFVLKSHLERRQRVAYRVAIAPSTTGTRARRQAGSTPLGPGQSAVVRRSFTWPRGEAYVASVLLPELDQRLRVRCPGGRR